MPNETTNSQELSSFHWGAALIIASLLVIGGGVIIWSHREPAPTPPGQPVVRSLPTPDRPLDTRLKKFHEVAFVVENGTPVVKIRVVPDGDELIVDAVTGRLIETRPGRPTTPRPMGKFAAPFAPMM